MIEEITKILKTYYDNHMYADRQFVLKITEIIKTYFNLFDYVNDVWFADNIKDRGNQYLSLYKVILINMYKLNNKEHYKQFGDAYYGLFNLFVLKTIFHEISHAHDEFMKDNEPNSLEGKILILDDPFTFIKLPNIEKDSVIEYLINKYKYEKILKYYDANYFLAPHERMAITRSCINMLDVIKNDFIIEASYYELFKDYITTKMNNVLNNYHLIDDYTNNPSLEYLWGLCKDNRSIILTDKSFYNYCLQASDRLFYGLSLSKDEYEHLDEVKNELIKKKSLL